MQWREKLPELEGLPLSPCGAGEKYKAPIVEDWPNKSFTPAQIAEMNGKVTCVGTRCGPDADNLLIVDIDGSSALGFVQNSGCSITDSGWRITRNNADDRLKCCFQICDSELEELLGDRKFVHSTGKGEQIELFWSKGQAIVLGDHKSSGGHYCWEGDPKQVGAPPPEWRDLLLKILLSGPKPSSVTATSGDWVDCIPCPICGRTEVDCRVHSSGSPLLCHHGSSWKPPEMKPGQMIDRNGVTWAFLQEQETLPGRVASLFKIHEERPKPTLPPPNGPVAALVRQIPDGRDEKGRSSRLNAGGLTTLLQASGFADRFRFNLLTLEVELDGDELNGSQAETAYVHFQHQGYDITPQAAFDALRTIAEQQSFHPVRDYLDGLRDVEPVDISRLASRYFRPADLSGPQSIYDRMMLKTLVAAVARVVDPGMKHDTCTVLKGGQGLRKTTFWSTLFGAYFAVFRNNINDKDALLCVHQHWGLEMGELDNITSSFKAGALKNFLTTQEDSFRPPYGRKVSKLPRPSIFVGSCNRSDFLHDETGERRWWVIPLELEVGQKIDIDTLIRDRDGIWKAANELFRSGYQTWLDDQDDALNNELNKDFAADSIAEVPVGQYLDRYGAAGPVDKHELEVYVAKELELSVDKIRKEVKSEMTRRGWTMVRPRNQGVGPRRRKWVQG